MREHIKNSAMVTAIKEHAASQRKSREQLPHHPTDPGENEATE
jgi:hypothetical protein